MSCVYYVTRLLPDYRLPVVDRLDELLEGRSLVVCHGVAGLRQQALSTLSRDKSLLPTIEMKNRWLAGGRFLIQEFSIVSARLSRGDVVLLEESPRTLNLLPFIRRCRRRGIPVVLWGHFSSNKRRFGSWHPFDRYRLLLAREASACVVYTEGIRAQLSRFVPAQRVFVANNTLDSSTLLRLRADYERVGRGSIRKQLALNEESLVLAYVGRLIPEKGIATLLDTARALGRSRDCAVVVIGDGPERNLLEGFPRSSCVTIRNLGAINDLAQIAPYVFAADVMVQPGYAGLSVNLGLLLGTPVATIPSMGKHRFHSPEIEFIRSGYNGEISPDNTPSSLAEAILRIHSRRSDYSRNAARFAETELTLDRMVHGLREAIAGASGEAHV